MNLPQPRNGLQLVAQMAESMKHKGAMLNERYLHHTFSHRLQQAYPGLLDVCSNDASVLLHPEWPTYKKQTGLQYGRYKKVGGHYAPRVDGTAGFVDFAIGQYERPRIGIEFCLKHSWSHEEVVWDLVKLLDKKNPFSACVSWNVVLRRNGLVKGGYLRNLEERMNRAFEEACHRLGETGVCDDSRKVHVIVTELDAGNNRRHWHCDRGGPAFAQGLPSVD